MRRLALAAFAASLALGPSSAATFRDGDRVCFFGDSITDIGKWHRALILYYVTRFPDRTVTFVNSGSGGDNADNARRVRLEPEVVARKPSTVVVSFGMNDFGFREYGTNATPEKVARRAQNLANYERNLTLLADAIKARIPGVTLYLMSPTPFDDVAILPKPYCEHPGANGGLVNAAEIVSRVAEKEGASFVDLNSAINGFYRRVRTADDGVRFAGDRIHPNASVHFLMAVRFLEAQDAPRVVSDVKLQDGRAVGARNATVSEIEWGEDRVAFTLLEKSLPWAVDPEATIARDVVLAAAARFNQEALSLYGLKGGNWTLKIDGQDVLTASARQWEVGVDLAGNEKTPQSRHAQDVCRENARLHERMGQVQVTNVWIMRDHSGKMRNQGIDPNDRAARERYFKAKWPEFGEWYAKRVENALKEWDDNDRLIRGVDEFWVRLRALATPRPHRYELTRE